MVFHVDGGCRRNGYANAIGAAAIVLAKNWGRPKVQRKALWSSPTPTNQRAEPTAIIMALERALQIYDEEEIRAYLDVTIYSDSQYAVNCMSTWVSIICASLKGLGVLLLSRSRYTDGAAMDGGMRQDMKS